MNRIRGKAAKIGTTWRENRKDSDEIHNRYFQVKLIIAVMYSVIHVNFRDQISFLVKLLKRAFDQLLRVPT